MIYLFCIVYILLHISGFQYTLLYNGYKFTLSSKNNNKCVYPRVMTIYFSFYKKK